MRLIPLNCVPNGAELGRDVPSAREDGIPLLRAGTPLTPRFKEALVRAGVHSVYVSDEATRGINPRPSLVQVAAPVPEPVQGAGQAQPLLDPA